MRSAKCYTEQKMMMIAMEAKTKANDQISKPL